MTLVDVARSALVRRFGINADRAPDEGFSDEVIDEILAALAPVLEQADLDRAALFEVIRRESEWRRGEPLPEQQPYQKGGGS